jgi:hypothetical protein
MTVLEYIKDLETKNILYGEKERPNSQVIMMHVNEKNQLLSILTELGEFKEAYVKLLEKSKDIINNKDYSADAKELGIRESNPDRWTREDKLRFAEMERNRLVKIREETGVLHKTSDAIKQLYTKSKLESEPSGNENPLEAKKIAAEKIAKLKPILIKLVDIEKKVSENLYSIYTTPVDLFFIVVDLIFYRSMVKWSEQIKDKDQLAQLYSVVYSKISEIQLYLSEFIKSIKTIPLDPINVLVTGRKMSQRFSQPISFEIIVSSYHQLGLGPEMENVKDSIIKINQDINELGLIDFKQNIPTLMKEINITEQYLEK